jgi:hypothetical protein
MGRKKIIIIGVGTLIGGLVGFGVYKLIGCAGGG